MQCVELLDDAMISAINQAGISKRQYPEKDSIFFKFVGSERATEEAIQEVRRITDKWGGKDFEASHTPEESKELWQGRKTALWSAMAMHPGEQIPFLNGHPYVTLTQTRPLNAGRTSLLDH